MPMTVPSARRRPGWPRVTPDEDVTFDDDALNPHFSYLDERSLRMTSGFLDAVTALNHMRACGKHWHPDFLLCGGWGGEDDPFGRILGTCLGCGRC